jgi:hypothetical protein
MMMVREGYRGTSARGIALGSQARELLAQYGPPSRRVEMRPGESWGYDTQRMAFQLRDAKVVSWLLF